MGLAGEMSCPSSSMLPASGGNTPVSTLISVDLPAPFWPISACTSPARKQRSTSSKALVPAKRLPMPRAWRTWEETAGEESPKEEKVLTPVAPACSVPACREDLCGLFPREYGFFHDDSFW